MSTKQWVYQPLVDCNSPIMTEFYPPAREFVPAAPENDNNSVLRAFPGRFVAWGNVEPSADGDFVAAHTLIEWAKTALCSHDQDIRRYLADLITWLE